MKLSYEKTQFYSPSYGKVSLAEAITIIQNKILTSPQSSYTLAVGTDSQNHSRYTKYVTVILLHEHGKGGMYFAGTDYTQIESIILERMAGEARRSIELAQHLVGRIENDFTANTFDISNIDLHLEIHMDYGPNGKSRDALQYLAWVEHEVPQAIVLAKPTSFAATHVADIHTK